MRHVIQKTFLLIFLSLGVVYPLRADMPATHQSSDEQDAALEAMRRGEIMSYAKIRRRAEARLKGKLVGAKLRRTGRGWIYEVRVRKEDGAVVFAILDARTGNEIRS